MSATWTTKALDLVRAVLISAETAAALAVVAIANLWPRGLQVVGEFFATAEPAVMATLFCAPVVVIVAMYGLGTKLLRPEKGRDVLVGWPDYWRLRLRVRVALVFGVVGCLGWFLGWVLLRLGQILWGTTIALASLTVALVALASVALAQHDLGDILDGA